MALGLLALQASSAVPPPPAFLIPAHAPSFPRISAPSSPPPVLPPVSALFANPPAPPVRTVPAWISPTLRRTIPRSGEYYPPSSLQYPSPVNLKRDESVSLPKKKRKRVVFDSHVHQTLNDWWQLHPTLSYPSRRDLAMLAMKTNLEVEQVRSWYHNHRTKRPSLVFSLKAARVSPCTSSSSLSYHSSSTASPPTGAPVTDSAVLSH